MDPLRAQQLAAELEVEMMADMYNRCGPPGRGHWGCWGTGGCPWLGGHQRESELSKGECVCLDRCVAKYLEVHERMGKKLTELSLQDEELLKRMQQGTGSA
ncbi:TI10B translocase, partial [Cnemophilus loriae]|nr:TI10B translocase [Cnemophilus loriae]